jgi:hypothetical protein
VVVRAYIHTYNFAEIIQEQNYIIFLEAHNSDYSSGSEVVEALCYKPEGRGFETDEVNYFFQFA